MTKISQDKIVRAAVGSARLEGYKGTLKAVSTKKVAAAPPPAKSKSPAKQ